MQRRETLEAAGAPVRLGLEVTRPPRALFPRGSGVPAARLAIWARQQSGNGRGASLGTAGTRPGSAAAAPQLLFRPRLCWQLPPARGRAR